MCVCFIIGVNMVKGRKQRVAVTMRGSPRIHPGPSCVVLMKLAGGRLGEAHT